MAEKLHYKIVVTGRVQGVGYRWSAANEAIRRNITGYVRNQSDGSVYIEAEGTSEQLDPFVDWCRRGPGMSHVKSVSIIKGSPINFESFRIEH